MCAHARVFVQIDNQSVLCTFYVHLQFIFRIETQANIMKEYVYVHSTLPAPRWAEPGRSSGRCWIQSMMDY